MAAKVISYTQVPIVQEDIRVIRLEALNPEATVFNLSVTYNIKDSEGALRGSGTFTQQVSTAPDPVLITQILAAANAAQGT